MNLHKLYIPVVIIIISILAFAAKAWVDERESRVRAEEQDKASKQIIAQKDQAISDRDKIWERQRLDFQRQIDGIKTIAEARQAVQPILLRSGTAPVAEHQVTKTELPKDVAASLPGAPDAKFTLLTDDQMI